MKTTMINTDKSKELDRVIEDFAKKHNLKLEKTGVAKTYQLQPKEEDTTIVKVNWDESNLHVYHIEEAVGFKYFEFRRQDNEHQVLSLPINVLNEILNRAAEARGITFEEMGIYKSDY